MKVLIAAGGTGGHIYPGIAIAKHISEMEPDSQIKFVGTNRGMETSIVPDNGFELELIRVKGFDRKLSFNTLKSFKELFLGMGDARRLLKAYKPDIVIGMGGYVCGPILLWASRMKIPTIIHEQNAFPGATNKLLSGFVDRIGISFINAREYFKNKNKIFLCGNPVRREFFKTDYESFRNDLGFSKEDFVVVSAGGSLGAESINKAMIQVITSAETIDSLKIIHITGKTKYDDFMAELVSRGIDPDQNNKIKILSYSDSMDKIYGCADLAVSRAGAMSVAELAAVGTPAIFIPYPYATDNHQEYNARSVTDSGGGILILDSDLANDPGILFDKISWLADKRCELETMRARMKAKAIIDSEMIFYNEIKRLLNGNA
ncbi:undecaprenyldiphospho-muramoylpentapeptide beta-N-acetylglucosaminyltransferase [Alkalibacter mobilis]|uniref:undecaprenyldiphospho-muramoylpentapeptide beta-N-acetylglucosaminyltransferase n=1 Tax=Alkalibacter mobilis TaxID=2787712 RepID=UPI00189CD93F|nr:undecaprenyldiphospho-muramoylpentapeptide beta-N-acetylglucosaminyltransferase [Alkalibacter mobilis]MBF7097130.1 undecaprenyldiphospho-muramoylpentapeptide beta-N-acetylglucosaminyltransferase [Alkalibacter mobilis]